MSNRYLEKIASFGAIAGSIGRVVGNGVKAFGNQVHTSFGGGFRDYAHDVLSIKDPSKLQNFSGSEKGLGNLRKAVVGQHSGFTARKEALNRFDKVVVPDLQKKQLDARITAGAITGVGVAGVLKGKHKYDEYQQNKQQQYYNY